MALSLIANNQELRLVQVLLDTGASDCVFKTDDLAKIGMTPHADDSVRTMTGIGGDEYVIEKVVEHIKLGELSVASFPIQMGAMDYGMQIDGIVGADFLLKTGAKIDFSKLEIT